MFGTLAGGGNSLFGGPGQVQDFGTQVSGNAGFANAPSSINT